MKNELLKNVGKTENIKEPWIGLVENVSNDIRQIGDDLVAFYVVGSVVRGKAVEKQSDVDFLAGSIVIKTIRNCLIKSKQKITDCFRLLII